MVLGIFLVTITFFFIAGIGYVCYRDYMTNIENEFWETQLQKPPVFTNVKLHRRRPFDYEKDA